MKDQKRYEEIRTGLSGRLLELFDRIWETWEEDVSPESALEAAEWLFKTMDKRDYISDVMGELRFIDKNRKEYAAYPQRLDRYDSIWWNGVDPKPDDVVAAARFICMYNEKKGKKRTLDTEREIREEYCLKAKREYKRRYGSDPDYDSLKIGFLFLQSTELDPQELLKIPPKELNAYLDNKDGKKPLPKKSGDGQPTFISYEEFRAEKLAEKLKEQSAETEEEKRFYATVDEYERRYGSLDVLSTGERASILNMLRHIDDYEESLLDMPPKELIALCRADGTPAVSYDEILALTKYMRRHSEFEELTDEDRGCVIRYIYSHLEDFEKVLEQPPDVLAERYKKENYPRQHDRIRKKLSGRVLEIFDGIWDIEELPSPESVRQAAERLLVVEDLKKEREGNDSVDILNEYKKVREIRKGLSDKTHPTLDELDSLFWNGEGQKPDDIIMTSALVNVLDKLRADIADIIG